MLLSAIDETHKGTYDFLYLPIDFKVKLQWIRVLSPLLVILKREINLFRLTRINAMLGMPSSIWCRLHTSSASTRFVFDLIVRSLIVNVSLCSVVFNGVYLIAHSWLLQAFNGKKWEKFNSEKVAYLAYARIQGKIALVSHFQNSSLMNEDKRCRPIVFQLEGQGTGDPVCFKL